MEIPNKYHNGKIYQITDIGYNKCYIGSTTEGLSHRMTRHRAGFKRFLNGNKLFVSSYDLFNEYGIENCKIELIEYFKCGSLQELRKREGEHIKNTDCVNKIVAGRTGKEYYEANKSKIIEREKEYQKQNKDKVMKRHQQYYQNNKDKILEQVKEYQKQYKDRINEQRKLKNNQIK